MATKISDLEESALTKVNASTTLEDIQTALNISKAAAEVSKINLDVRNASAQIGLERFKVWPSLVVPIVSLLTVVATIWIQNLQLAASRRENEDKQWREFLKPLEQPPGKTISDITLVPRLRSFMHSANGSEATDVAKRLLGNLVNKDSFDDLLGVLYPSDTQSDTLSVSISDAHEISRNLLRTRAPILDRCQSLIDKFNKKKGKKVFNNCNDTFAPNAFIDLSDFSDEDVKGLRVASQDYLTWISEEFEFSKITALSFKRAVSQAVRNVDFSGGYMNYVDLSHANFSRVKIPDATFDAVNLTSAVLVPEKWLNVNLSGSNWWDAEKVEAGLLDNLIKKQYPGSIPGQSIVKNGEFTKEIYVKRVMKLCEKVSLKCPADKFGFGTYPFNTADLPTGQ